MKIKRILKLLGVISAFAFSPYLFTSCGGSSSGSSSEVDDALDDADNDDDAVEEFTRVTLAGDTTGTVPIDTNTEPEIRIDGQQILQRIISDNGVVVVDVPLGSFLEVRFVPDPDVIGFVGNVVCIYDDEDPVTVTSGEQAVLPGVSPYTCPLDVDSGGGVTFVDNPTLEQLGAGLEIKEVITAAGSGIPGFVDGASLVVNSNAIIVGGITYVETSNQELLEAFSDAESTLRSSAPDLDSFDFFISGRDFDDFILFLVGRDGQFAGQIAYADGVGNVGAANFCLD